MSWLSGLIQRNRGWAGNALKNVSPFLALTPLGIPAALAGGALGRAIQPGAKIGDIAKSGLSNAALGAGVQGGMGALRSAFSPSSSAAAASYGGAPGAAAGPIGGQVMGVGTLTGPAGSGLAQGGGGGPGLLSQLGGALGKVGGFAESHPHAIEMGLGALDTSKRDYLKAQTDALTQNTGMNAEQWALQKRRQDALAPLLAAFAGQLQTMQQHPYQIASNPYGGR
jgi:hypothetical protein